jgi:hypothetical protein
LLVTAIIGAVIFNASAPPDRSSPRATVIGYYAALQAQNYNLAWQFSADTITNATSQASFIDSLQQENAQLGRVEKVDQLSIANDSSGTTTVQLNVVRTHSPTVSNTLILGLYNGNLWLINSITTP